jgi:transposase InsO family protein
MIAQLITPTHLAIPPRRPAPPLRTQTPTSDRPGAQARPARIHRSSNRTRGADGRASLPGSLRWRTQAGAHDWIRMTRRDDRRLSLLCAVTRSCGSRTTSGEVWLWRAAVEDTYSRLIAGWSMATHMRASLVVDAPKRALARRRPDPGLIHHSDQGGQYVSLPFGRAVREAGSRSRRAPAEMPTTTRSPRRSSRPSRKSSLAVAAGCGLSSTRRCSSTSMRSTTASAGTPASRCSPRSPPTTTTPAPQLSAMDRPTTINITNHTHQVSRKPGQVRRSALALAQMRRRNAAG